MVKNHEISSDNQQEPEPDPQEGSTREPTSRELMTREMDTFTALLSQISHPKIAGHLQGKLEGIVQRVVDAERKNVKLIKKAKQTEIEKEVVTGKLNEVVVLPALLIKLKWYQDTWCTGGTTSEDFLQAMNELLPWYIEKNMRDSIFAHAEKWNKILTSSPFPAVKELKKKLREIFPNMKLGPISHYFGLLQARLNNLPLPRGKLGRAELKLLGDPEALIKALKAWSGADDTDKMNILKAFLELTVGR